MGKTLTVANLEQKVIYYAEMQGQISDGHWENAKPNRHYLDWNLDWNGIETGHPVGRSFWARKTNYNFASKELLDVVGERLLNKIKLTRLHPAIVMRIIQENHWLIPDSLREICDRDKLMNLGFRLEWMLEAEKDNSYTMKDLRRDCQELKVAVRTYVNR